MKYASIIQDTTYLLWQQELQGFNFHRLGLLDDLVVGVLVEPGATPSPHARRLAEMMDVRFFENHQARRHYLASNKPYGLAQVLKADPELGRQLFLLDSDVIFREALDFSALTPGREWYVSDSGAIGYLGWNYLTSHATPEEIAPMAALVGLTNDRLKAEQPNSGGAQYLMKNVTAVFCEKVASDSIALYDYVTTLKREDGTFKLQVWTAEMWAWLWNAFHVAPVRISREMDFAWGPHQVADWDTRKMLHLAGVTGAEPGCFYKGKYMGGVPWEVEPNFDFVSRERCWWPYVQLIEAYKAQGAKIR